jgi:two-component system sensor histidine kinase FlrB
MPTADIHAASELAQAFLAFHQVSEDLAASYRALEARVHALNAELASARSARLEELAERERLANRLQHLLSVLPAGVIVLEGDGTVQDANPAAVELLGQPLIGQAWTAVIERAFLPRPDDGHEISLHNGRRVSVATQSLSPHPGQIVLLTDMTGTRALQERVHRHERLCALGEMSARLAHQLRTPLASALLYAAPLSQPALAATERRRIAGKLLERLRHLERLINDMLVFARGGGAGMARIRLDELIAALQQALEAPLGNGGCTLAVEHVDAEMQIYASRETLLGALMNLAVNAVQACGHGGRLRLYTVVNAQQVEIVLADNGPGIPAALQERIFEPFFTTRADGTGLGLAVAQSVVRAHGGSLRVESQAGAGATFRVCLPAADALERLSRCVAPAPAQSGGTA